jgi:hypothetical protein
MVVHVSLGLLLSIKMKESCQCSMSKVRKKGKVFDQTKLWLENILSLLSDFVREGCASSKNVVTAARSMAWTEINTNQL